MPDIEGEFVHRLEFYIPGRPHPWKHGKPVAIGGYARVIDPPQNRAYKEIVRHHFLKAVLRDKMLPMFTEPWEGVIMMHLHAYFLAPQDMWQGKLPTQANDTSNLAKMIEDALQAPHVNTVRAASKKRKQMKGFVPEPEQRIYAMRNDSRIVQGVQSKRFSRTWEGTHVILDYYMDVPKPRKLPKTRVQTDPVEVKLKAQLRNRRVR